MYKWLINQKSLFREGKLSQEKIQKLNDINIHWPSYLKRSKTWNDMYELATKYYKHYGNLEVDKKFKTNDGINYCEDGLNLGMWLVFQIYKYKNNNLSIKKIRLLEEININWDILYRKEYWNKMYELAKKNYEHFGKLTVPAKFKTINGYEYNDEGYDLGKWVSNQKINYK